MQHTTLMSAKTLPCSPPAGDLRGAKTSSPPPGRSMKHAIRSTVLLVFATGLLAVPPTAVAEAGTYTQWVCRTPDGTPAPVEGFLHVYGQGSFEDVPTDACGDGRTLHMEL